MKKEIIALMLIMSAGLALSPSDFGCEPSGNDYKCMEPPLLLGLDVKFLSDVTCVSTNYSDSCGSECASMIDGECMAIIDLQQPYDFQRCYSYYTNSTPKDDDCQADYLSNGTYLADVLPQIIDFSKCSSSVVNESYSINCPFNGKEMLVNGTTDEANSMIMIFEKQENQNISSVIYQNLVYIILGIAIIILLIWALMPKQEKKVKK